MEILDDVQVMFLWYVNDRVRSLQADISAEEPEDGLVEVCITSNDEEAKMHKLLGKTMLVPLALLHFIPSDFETGDVVTHKEKKAIFFNFLLERRNLKVGIMARISAEEGGICIVPAEELKEFRDFQRTCDDLMNIVSGPYEIGVGPAKEIREKFTAAGQAFQKAAKQLHDGSMSQSQTDREEASEPTFYPNASNVAQVKRAEALKRFRSFLKFTETIPLPERREVRLHALRELDTSLHLVAETSRMLPAPRYCLTDLVYVKDDRTQAYRIQRIQMTPITHVNQLDDAAIYRYDVVSPLGRVLTGIEEDILFKV